jgi:hypothetical protein
VIYDLNGNAVDSTFLYTNIAKVQTCTNQFLAVTDNVATAGNCKTVTSAYVDASIATASTLVNGNYVSASGAHGTQDSTVPAGPYTIPLLTAAHGGSTMSFSASTLKANVYGINVYTPISTSKFSYRVDSTADNTANTYDVGIYSGTSGGTCTLIVSMGSTAGTTFAPATSTWHQAVAWSQGTKTLNPGRYYLALTGTAAGTALLTADSTALTFVGGTGNVTITGAGGTLPSTFTCPSDSATTTSVPDIVIN